MYPVGSFLSKMVVEGSQQETLDSGFVLLGTRQFDAEKNEWILPQMVIEHTQLPSVNSDNSSSRHDSNYGTTDGNVEYNAIKDLKWADKKESRLYAKLDDRIQSNYFASRRADQILRNAGSEFERYRFSNHMARLNNFSCKLTTGNTESASLSSCEVKSTLDTYLHCPEVRKKPMNLNPMSEFALNSTHVYGQESLGKVKWHSKI
ncbi:unnamed protein product [Schistosoma curassoni]|uniref:Anaphase-promoting complex subunit 13 n=1 Tax=Schistosoma curassoni TaxID=6186 RepID=A0A183KZ73_9TREM|nr:unnamed protein product [Schistosoma curassoni]